ncbi:MAG: GntR family transcriptional regulator [Opitutus sp.]|nr:GntR family transcriptional regulator [Opitutus sp.]
MTLLPHRTVASQVAAQLREQIQSGAWREWLPVERELCKKFHVSRDTLRKALAQLRREEIVTVSRGVGRRIVPQAGRIARRPALRTIGLLAPEPLTRLRPINLLWMDELKGLLQSAGFELKIHHGLSYYHSKHGQALARLVRREPQSAWILVLAKEPMQRWFFDNRIPCIIAGSGCAGIDLPTVDLDYRGICRHAANTLVRAGHRRIVLLNHRSPIGGDLASEIGLQEASQFFPAGNVQASVAYHDESLDSITSVVRQLMTQRVPPTGIIVANSSWYAATLTALAKHGLGVPEDVSLISRDDDVFLDYLIPPPARYRNDPRVFAKKVLAQVLRVVEPSSAPPADVRIIPQFHAGKSVSAPRSPTGMARA